MKVLLDECVDSRLQPHLDASFHVHTVAQQGWAGISNGELLALAEAEFDVFVTVDRNLSFQQHLPKFALAVVLVTARSNRIADLLEFVPDIVRAIPDADRGAVTRVGLEGQSRAR